jgi:uncharacterized protein
MRSTACMLALVLLLLGCGGRETLDEGSLAIRTAEGLVAVRVQIADTAAERARGLMGRASLADDAGMAFLFSAPTRSGFWMKDTVIPLSIAFWDPDGRVVSILDMAPCGRDPCPVYRPERPYTGAVEVNQGYLAQLGVQVGDRVELER